MKGTAVICRKHWSAYIPTGIIAVLIIAVGIAAGVQAGNPATALFCIVLAAVILVGDIALTNVNRLFISNGEVTGRTGLIRSVKIAAPVSRVQDVSISNGLLGKLFGYHTIVVTTAGTGGKEFIFTGATNAEQFQRAFLDQAS